MMRSLITGGTGFIGRALVKELLSRGDEIVVFDRGFSQVSDTIHRTGTILNPHDLVAAAQDVDEIYHLAGVLGTTELLDQAELAIDVNIKGTFFSLEAARLCGVTKFIYASKPNNWLNMYSITKATGEELCRLYRKFQNIDIRILRWLNAYGPGQKLYPIRKAVPVFILQALYNLPLEIWGDGNQRVDLIHIKDLAFVTIEFSRAKQEIEITYDTGLCHSISVNDLATLIVKLCGSTSRLVHLPMRRGEDTTIPIPLLPTVIDLLKVNRKAVDIEIGLEETINYYKNLDERDRHRALTFYYGKNCVLNDAAMTLEAKKAHHLPTTA